jgi:hypothetical protein
LPVPDATLPIQLEKNISTVQAVRQVSCLGHGDADIAAAMKDQIDKLSFAHTSFFTSPPAETLADLLIANAPSGIDRVYFVSGGSEAIEASLKLARQYFVETGSPQRTHIIARKQSYHGNTLGALAAGGNAWRREQFAPFYSLPAISSLVIAIAEKPMARVIMPMGNAWPMRLRPKSCGLARIRSWRFSPSLWLAQRLARLRPKRDISPAFVKFAIAMACC